jgi:hypothetical protein
MDPVSTLLSLVTIPLTFFLPGYFTYSAARHEGSDGQGVVTLQKILMPILISVVITSWISMALLILGVFSLASVLSLIGIYTFIVALRFRRKINLRRLPKIVIDRRTVFLVLLVIVAVVLFFRPFEDTFGYGDGYIQVNIGGMIAKHGAVTFNDPLISSVPRDVMSYFTFKDGQLFNNLNILNYSTGEVGPSFLHLYPTWIAIFYSAFGIETALYVTPIIGLLSLLVIFLLTRELFDWKTAALASSILVLTFLQIWFSRSHNAEILLQLLLFTGILTYILSRRSSDNFLLTLSALTFGLTFFTKVEASLIVIPIFIYFTSLNFFGKLERRHLYFIVPFFVSLVIAVVYYLYIVPGYVLGSFFAADIPQEILVGIVLIPILVNITPRRVMRWIADIVGKNDRMLQHAVVLLVIAYFAYAIITFPTTSYSFNGWNLEQLALYLTPVVFVLGIIGLLIFIYKRPYGDNYFFIGLLVIFLVFFIPNIHHSYGGPWWMRRYIFAVVPLICICAAYCVFVLRDRFSLTKRKAITALLVSSLIIPTLFVSAPILNYVEYKGEINQTKEIFGSFDSDSILVFADASYPHAAYALREIFDKNALVLRRDFWGVRGERTNQTCVEKFMEAYSIWHDSGLPVYVVSPSHKFLDAFDDELTFTLYREGRIYIPYLELSMNSLPDRFIYIDRDITIYLVTDIHDA